MDKHLGKITLTQRGRRYALGHGADFYGIWDIATSYPRLVERFPLHADGWFRARRRFEELENAPEQGPVALRAQRRPSAHAMTCAGIVLAGVVLGIVGLFPHYIGGLSLASQGDQLLPHLFYLSGWVVAAAFFLVGGRVARVGALFGSALSAMTFGFFLGDLGEVLAGNGAVAGTGLYLGLIGWLVCAVGCVLALFGLRDAGALGGPVSRLGLAIGGTLLALGTAITFAPSWDRYVLFAAATGRSEVLTEGNAFSNPRVVIAGDVVVMVLIVALVYLALAWRPRLLGAGLFVGALLPIAAEVFSALVQDSSPPPLNTFGITPAQAAQAQLHITAGFTLWFYLYCAFLGLLMVYGALVAGYAVAKEIA